MSAEFDNPRSYAMYAPKRRSDDNREEQELRKDSPAVDKSKVTRIRAILESFSESSAAVVLRAAVAQLWEDRAGVNGGLVGLEDVAA